MARRSGASAGGGRQKPEAPRYAIATVGDLIELWRKLPEGRREVMLDEMMKSVRMAGAYADLLEACGVAVKEWPSATWIDDDKGEGAITARDLAGTELVTLRFAPIGGEAA